MVSVDKLSTIIGSAEDQVVIDLSSVGDLDYASRAEAAQVFFRLLELAGEL